MASPDPAAATELQPPWDRVQWCVLFRNPEQTRPREWRLYDKRGSHHGASLEMSEAKIKHPSWEFRIAKKTSEWVWDD